MAMLNYWRLSCRPESPSKGDEGAIGSQETRLGKEDGSSRSLVCFTITIKIYPGTNGKPMDSLENDRQNCIRFGGFSKSNC